ncbi:MAG: ABC transporter ATP-binding protein, partial [Candidatus Eisenbacteria bacterium]
LLLTPLKLLMPVPLKIVVDSVIGERPAPRWVEAIFPDSLTGSQGGLLVLAVVLLVGVTLLIYAQSLGLWLGQTYTGQKLVLRFRAKLFRHVQRLSLSYHDEKGTTDSTYRIQYDAPAIQWVALDGVIPLVTSSVMIVSMIGVIAALDRTLAVISVAVVPVLLALTRVCGRRMRDQWSNVKKTESSAMSVLQETLSSLRVVKAFGQEDRQHAQFMDRSTRSIRGQMRVAFTKGGFDLLVGAVLAFGTAVVLFLGVKHVQASTLSLGNLIIIMTYLGQLYGPLETITYKMADLQSGLASAERALSLLREAPEVVERPNPVPVRRAAGRIRFENMSFGYDPRAPVLREVNARIPAGTRVGIIGKTGAGKSTLLSLLMRFFDPTEGRILLDETDLRDYELAGLRNQFSLVLQDPVLFSATLAENIAYARPEADPSDVIEAARAANAHDFIVRLPDGYDTQVGERGMKLSGGERQRISLARAFLKDAPILILDEPTSSVDVETESVILDATMRLLEGRTSIMITHRPGSLADCDLLLKIENGRVHGAPLKIARAERPARSAS